MTIHLTKALRVLFSLGLATALAAPAYAATQVFTSGNLDLSASWNAGAGPVPISTDIAQFGTAVTSSNFTSALNFGEIQVTAGQTGTLTLGNGGGNKLTLSGVSGVGIDLSAATVSTSISAGVIIGASQTWQVPNGLTLTMAGVISGTAGNTITFQGGGSLQLNGANTQTNNLIMNGGTLNISASGCYTASAGALGGGNSSATGPGTLTLMGTPTFRSTTQKILGALTTSAQSNVIVSTSGGGAGRFLFDTKNLDLNNNVTTFTVTTPGSVATSGGAGNISFGFQVTSQGTVYIPTMSITNGTFDLESSGLSGGNDALVGWISQTAFGGTALNATVTNNTGLIIGSGVKTYLGGTNDLGTGVTAANLTVNLGGNLDLSDQGANSRNTEIFALSGAGNITNGSTGTGTATLTVSGSTYNSIFSGVIKNGSTAFVALSKTGGSLLSLSGVNTYTGATTISGGTLAVIGSGSITGSAISINSGGTLAGNGTMGTVTLSSNGAIAPGSGVLGNVGILSTGALTLGANGTYALDLNNTGVGTAGTDWDQIAAGTTTITAFSGAGNTLVVDLNSTGAGSWNPGVSTTWDDVITTSGLTGYAPANFSFVTTGFNGANPSDFSIVPDSNPNNLDLVYTAVPEPATWGLLASVIALLAARRRRA
jgi:fibronectin-binding autotransporter adhesin